MSLRQLRPARSFRRPAILQQPGKLEQVTNSEVRPFSADCNERVLRVYTCPSGREAPETATVVMAVDPFFSPVVPVRDQLKPAPIERMERVPNVETSHLISTTGCI